MLYSRDVYCIEFETMQRATYWMDEFCRKLKDEVRHVNKFEFKVEFNDRSVYYFRAKDSQFLVPRNNVTFYDESAIYIILDDPERHRIMATEEDNECQK